MGRLRGWEERTKLEGDEGWGVGDRLSVPGVEGGREKKGLGGGGVGGGLVKLTYKKEKRKKEKRKKRKKGSSVGLL